MVDPITAVGAGLAVLGSKDILDKVLGPTAEYLGSKTAGLVEKCDVNLDSIIFRAYKKLGDRSEVPGSVNARVLKHVVEDGRFVEDELVAEYYGGMLASSKSPNGSDDRSLPHLSRVKSMSVYQIRLHFLIYLSVLRIFHGETINVGDIRESNKLKIYLPFPAIKAALQPDPPASWISIFTHSINGLYNEGLAYNIAYGSIENLRSYYPDVPAPGLVVDPTFIGAELFLWAIGGVDPDGHQFLSQDATKIETPIVIEQSAVRVNPK